MLAALTRRLAWPRLLDVVRQMCSRAFCVCLVLLAGPHVASCQVSTVQFGRLLRSGHATDQLNCGEPCAS